MRGLLTLVLALGLLVGCGSSSDSAEGTNAPAPKSPGDAPKADQKSEAAPAPAQG